MWAGDLTRRHWLWNGYTMLEKSFVIPRGISSLLLVSLLFACTLTSCGNRTFLEEEKKVAAVIKPKDEAPAHKPFKVWLVKPSGERLDLVSVDRAAGTKDDLKDAVEELLRGPTPEESGAGVSSEIPRGTVLLGINRDQDTIVLNLSHRFATDAGSSSLEMRIEQLKRTVSDLADGKKVYLDIEGERLTTAAGEGLEIKQPIN